MNYSQSRQVIEQLLTQIRSSLVQLMMKKPKINPKVDLLIQDIDAYLKQLVATHSEVFKENRIAKEEAIEFYNLLLELYLDSFDSLQLGTVIETEEEANIVDEFKEKVMLLMEEISKFMD